MGSKGKKDRDKIVSQWVNSHADELYSWAYYKTSSKIIAEDLTQEVFAAAFKSFDRFRGDSSPKTWLFSILNRQIIDYYRKNSKQSIFIPESNMNENFEMENKEFVPDYHLLDDPEFLEVYNSCLEKLQPKWRGILISKFVEKKDNDDICKEYDISLSNLWQIVHRTKKMLKTCLDKNWN